MKKLVMSLLFLSLATAAANAESNWVTEFLTRYQPAMQGAAGVQVQAGSLPLATQDIVRLLLENNRDLIVNRLGPASSTYATAALFRTFEPNVHFTGSVDRTKSPSRSQLIGASALNQLTHNYAVGVDQNLEIGTAYSVDFTLNRTSSNSAFNLFNPSWAGGITYSVSQPFLRNFGRNINTRQIRIAQANEKISQIQFEIEVINLVAAAENDYWDLVFNRENEKVKQRSMELAQKTQHDNETQVSIGTLAPIELIQSEAEVATRHEDLITAQHNAQLLEDQVKKLITNQPDPGLVLARLTPTQPAPGPTDKDVPPIEEALRIALENRPEMRQADYTIQSRNVDVEYMKNQLLPIVDVNARYAQSGLGGTRTIVTGSLGSDVVSVGPGGIGSVFSQLFGFDYPGYTLGFNVEIPISNKAAHADYSRALNDQRTATLNKDAIAQQIALDVRNAYTMVDLNRAQIDTARVAHQLAIRRLDAEEKKFALGTSTVRFVLEEQRNLAQAETDEIQSLVNYSKALVAYNKAVGITLKKNNIDIESQLAGQAGPKTTAN